MSEAKLKSEIVRLQGIVKKLESELHECCMGALEIGSLADMMHQQGSDSQRVAVAVVDACSDLYQKHDYRVKGWSYENIVLGEVV